MARDSSRTEPDIPQIVACVGRSVDGVDFQSLDGSPRTSFTCLFLNLHKAHISRPWLACRGCSRTRYQQRLLDAPDSAAMYSIIKEEDARLGHRRPLAWGLFRGELHKMIRTHG